MEHYPDVVGLSLRSLEFNKPLDNSTFDMRFASPNKGTAKGDSELEDGTCFDVVVRFESWQNLPLPQLLAALDTAFNFSTIATLQLDQVKGLDTPLFMGTFAQLPKLRRLSFTQTSIYGILEELRRSPALKAKGRKGSRGRTNLEPYFPALSAMEFSFIDFEEGDMLSVTTVDSIVDVVKKRPRAFSVEDISLTHCRKFGTNEFEMLSKALPRVNVDWDNEEGFDSGGSGLDDT